MQLWHWLESHKPPRILSDEFTPKKSPRYIGCWVFTCFSFSLQLPPLNLTMSGFLPTDSRETTTNCHPSQQTMTSSPPQRVHRPLRMRRQLILSWSLLIKAPLTWGISWRTQKACRKKPRHLPQAFWGQLCKQSCSRIVALRSHQPLVCLMGWHQKADLIRMTWWSCPTLLETLLHIWVMAENLRPKSRKSMTLNLMNATLQASLWGAFWESVALRRRRKTRGRRSQFIGGRGRRRTPRWMTWCEA